MFSNSIFPFLQNQLQLQQVYVNSAEQLRFGEPARS